MLGQGVDSLQPGLLGELTKDRWNLLGMVTRMPCCRTEVNLLFPVPIGALVGKTIFHSAFLGLMAEVPDSVHVLLPCYPQSCSPGPQYLMHVPSPTGIHNASWVLTWVASWEVISGSGASEMGWNAVTEVTAPPE